VADDEVYGGRELRRGIRERGMGTRPNSLSTHVGAGGTEVSQTITTGAVLSGGSANCRMGLNQNSS
jgi:hypothetical protein